jgi:ribulose-phosphate 3-epimerase
VVERIVKVSPVPVDTHLMIAEPDRWAPGYAEAGAGSVTFHAEAASAPVKLARELRGHGARAGMALRPATPVEPYAELLPELDMLLLMTVEPGFGGQKFLDLVLPKVRAARELAKGRDLDLWIQVDGGVGAETIERCAEAGADVFVAGSAVYGAEDAATAVQRLRAAAESATASSWWSTGGPSAE